jgi:hypothetical protein
MTVVIAGNNLHSAAYGSVKIEREDINEEIAAVGVRVKGNLSPDDAANPCWILVKEIYVEGYGQRQVKCATSSSYPPTDINYIYNKTVTDKLSGKPNVIVDDAGEVSEIEARQYARRLLQASHELAARRSYRVDADIPATLPKKGDILTMPDGWDGVVLGWIYSTSGVVESLTLEMVNFDQAGY